MDTEFMCGYLQKMYENPGIEMVLEEQYPNITLWRSYLDRIHERICKENSISLSREVQDTWQEVYGRLLYQYIEAAYVQGAKDREQMLK